MTTALRDAPASPALAAALPPALPPPTCPAAPLPPPPPAGKRFTVKASPMMPLSAVVADVLGQLGLAVRPEDCTLTLRGKPVTDLTTPFRFANVGRDKLELRTGERALHGYMTRSVKRLGLKGVTRAGSRCKAGMANASASFTCVLPSSRPAALQGTSRSWACTRRRALLHRQRLRQLQRRRQQLPRQRQRLRPRLLPQRRPSQRLSKRPCLPSSSCNSRRRQRHPPAHSHLPRRQRPARRCQRSPPLQPPPLRLPRTQPLRTRTPRWQCLVGGCGCSHAKPKQRQRRRRQQTGSRRWMSLFMSSQR